MPPILLHYLNGELESVTVCEMEPDVEMSILLSVLDPFCKEEEDEHAEQ